MKKFYFALPVLTFAALFASSCQSDIDLNNIDTNVAMSVKNLTVPIKLDAVKLDAVLDIKDDDANIKKMVDPQSGEVVYAVVKEGTFETNDPVKIDPVTVGNDKTYDTQTLLAMLKKQTGGNAPSRKAPGTYYYYDLSTSLNDLKNNINLTSYEGKIPKEIDIDEIGDLSVDFTLTTTLDLAKQLVGLVDEATLQNVSIKLIEGLEDTPCFDGYIVIGEKKIIMEGADAMMGTLAIKEAVTVVPGKETELTIHVNKVYGDAIRKFASLYEVKKAKSKAAAKEERGFKYDADFGFESGELAVNEEKFVEGVTVEDLPITLEFDATPSTEPMKVTSFSGHVEYDLEEKINIPDVELKDLPDFLSDAGTEIKLQNPQLYIKLHNPVVDGTGKAAKAQTGFTFTNWYSENNQSKQGSQVKLADDAVIADNVDNIFCISSTNVTKMYEGFTGAKLIECKDLGNILSTDKHGLPNKIDIVANGCMVNGEVTDLDLTKTDFGKAKGEYLFYVPMALGKGSMIAYSTKADGWSSEDLEKLLVKSMCVKAKATTDVPLTLELFAKPLNSKGEVIKNAQGNEITATCTLNPKADNQDIELKFEGDIKDLDGIDFKVTLKQEKDGTSALSPNMNIKLENIKVTVSGNYETEL